MVFVVIVLLGIVGMLVGWFLYFKFIVEKIFKFSESFVMFVYEVNDGIDYVLINKVVLWGYYFILVVGVVFIVGFVIVVYWGWVFVVLWVVFGIIFFVGIYDMGVLWVSVWYKGKFMGVLFESVIGKCIWVLFMIVVFLVLFMVNVVFGVVIVNSFVF